MKGIFNTNFKINKCFAIVLSVVLMVTLIAGSMLISNSFSEIEEAYAASAFYIYGVETYTYNEGDNNSETFKMELFTSNGVSGTWKKASTVDGTYEDIGTGASIDLGGNNIDGWYRCNYSTPIHILEVMYDSETHSYSVGGDPAFISGNSKWLISDKNETIAYSIQNYIETYGDSSYSCTTINVVGKYTIPEKVSDSDGYNGTYSGQTVWIKTSFRDAWYLYGSSLENPTTDDSYTQFLDNLSARITRGGVAFTVKLGADQKAICIRNDVMVGDSYVTSPLFGDSFYADNAPMEAVLKDDTSLDYIYLIGAPVDADEDLKDKAAAFAFAPVERPDKMAIGSLSHNKPFYTNTLEGIGENNLSYYSTCYTYGTFNNTNNVVLKVQDVDSGMSVSWTNRQPGDTISFIINAGAASDMSQLKDPVQEVMELIEEIDNPVVYPDSQDAIDEARKAYDELTPEQKEQIENYNKLTAAEQEFRQKEEAARPQEQTPGGDTPQPEKKTSIQDKDSKVEIKTKDDVAIPNDVTLKVEVKNSVKETEVEKDYSSVKVLLKDNEVISKVYDVKLIRTVNGVEQEIQPSDINGVTSITVQMPLPKGVKNFRLFHIHAADDVEEITNYKVNKGIVEFEITKLSEFAIATVPSHGFCIGWVVFIFAILELLCTCVYVIIRFGLCKELVAKCKLDCLYNKMNLLGLICLCVSAAIFIFALIALCLHVCAISIISFILALLICLAYTYFFAVDHDVLKLLKGEKKETKE